MQHASGCFHDCLAADSFYCCHHHNHYWHRNPYSCGGLSDGLVTPCGGTERFHEGCSSDKTGNDVCAVAMPRRRGALLVVTWKSLPSQGQVSGGSHND